MERYHITLGQLGFDSCVVITGEFICASELSAPDKTWLYPALREVIHEHPALGVQIHVGDKQDTPKFVRLPTVDMDSIVHWQNSGSDRCTLFEELLLSELGKPIELGTSSPLWRLTITNGRSPRTKTITFAYHHAIADGISGPVVLKSLLNALNGQYSTSDEVAHSVDIPPDSTIVPPIESFMDISMTWSVMSKILYKLVAPSSWSPTFTAWTGHPIVLTPSLDMSLRCWEISARHTTELLRLCREHGTTLTAFLHTLVVRVLSNLVLESQEGQLRPHKTIATAVPVSLRRFTDASPFVLCDHVASSYFHIPIEPTVASDTGMNTFPWHTAKTFRTHLQDSFKDLTTDLRALHLLFRLSQGEAHFRGLLGKKRGAGVTVSNLGKFPLRNTPDSNHEQAWALGPMYFAQCDVVRGSAIKVNVLGSPNGATNVTFTWGIASVEAEFMERFIDGVKAMVASIVQ